MKKTRYLAATLGLLLALGMGVVAEVPGETGLPAAARERLESYIAFRYTPDGADIAALARARAPWNLTEDMSARVFGESVYFPSDYGPRQRVDGDTAQLPFPPKEVWCVSLVARPSPGLARGIPSREVVLLGLHLDMHNGDWLVHLWPDELSRGVAADLAGAQVAAAAVGCVPGWEAAVAAAPVP